MSATRSTPRAARVLRPVLPAACCVALAAGITAQGACVNLLTGTNSGGSTPVATIALAPRYVLTNVSGQALPRVIRQDADGTITRVLADTLVLTPGPTSAGGTFNEVAVIGVVRPGQAESVATTTVRGAAYTRQSSNAVQFSSLAGVNGPGGTSAVAGTLYTVAGGGTNLQISVAAGLFVFASR